MELDIIARETAARTYRPLAYCLVKVALDVVVLRLLPAALFALFFYPLMGLQASVGHTALFFATVMLFNLGCGTLSFAVALSSPVGSATLLATTFYLIGLLFSGFLVNGTTSWVIHGLCHASMFYYAFETLMVNELTGLVLTFQPQGLPEVTVYGDIFLHEFGFAMGHVPRNLLMLVLMAGVATGGAYLLLARRCHR